MPRIQALIEAKSVRLRIPQSLLDQIDRLAATKPEATRSSMIRSLLRDRIQQIIEETEKSDAREEG